MPQSRQARDSALTLRLIAAGVLLGLALAAAWPATSPAGAATTTTFLYTGAQQTFVVPAGVTSVQVLAVGGRGGNGLAPGGGLGGAPAEVSGDLEVFPGQKLYVEVGGIGVDASSETIARAFNGGEFAGMGSAGGGGASDVRLVSRPENDTLSSLFSRLLVAAGGGGGGEGIGGTIGGAGGQAGAAGGAASVGTGPGGAAGTEESGGSGCGGSCNGKLGSGSQGATIKAGTAGGGGGGGLFGGGGGEPNGMEESGGGGGGGGSSLQPQGGKTVIPAAAAAPEVQITYTPPAPVKGPEPKPSPSIPSNAFTLLHPIVGANRSITLVLDPAGAGTITASATSIREVVVRKHGRRIHRKVRFTFGTARTTPGLGGALELAIKPSAAGRKALAAHKRLSISIAVTFTPNGGKAASKTTTIALPRR